jgi:hypothetical protein
MRQHLRIKTRTLLITILAVVLSAQGLSLFFDHNSPDGDSGDRSGPDFLLEVNGEPGGVEFLEGSRPKLPLFNPMLGRWTVGDQQVLEFASLVQGLEVGPHGSSPFVIVTLPTDATVGDYRRAIASLSRHGVCRVGIYALPTNEDFVSLRADVEPSRNVFVPVYRVLEMKLDSGASRPCTDRFPAWPPWGM